MAQRPLQRNNTVIYSRKRTMRTGNNYKRRREREREGKRTKIERERKRKKDREGREIISDTYR